MPAARPSAPTCCCCPGPRTRTSGATSRRCRCRARSRPRPCCAPWPSRGGPLSTAALETAVDVRRTRLELLLKVLDVDGAVQRVRAAGCRPGVPWAYDAERYARVAAARAGRAAADGRLRAHRRVPDGVPPGVPRRRHRGALRALRRLRRALVLRPRWPTGVVGAARERLARAGVDLDPRVQWPTGMDRLGVPVKGKIPPDEALLPGRALARLSDLGWGQRLREVLREDAPAHPDLLRACVPGARRVGLGPAAGRRRGGAVALAPDAGRLARGGAVRDRPAAAARLARPRPRRPHRRARRQQRVPARRGVGAARRRARAGRGPGRRRRPGAARRRPRLVAVDPHRGRAGAAPGRRRRRCCPSRSPSTAEPTRATGDPSATPRRRTPAGARPLAVEAAMSGRAVTWSVAVALVAGLAACGSTPARTGGTGHPTPSPSVTASAGSATGTPTRPSPAPSPSRSPATHATGGGPASTASPRARPAGDAPHRRRHRAGRRASPRAEHAPGRGRWCAPHRNACTVTAKYRGPGPRGRAHDGEDRRADLRRRREQHRCRVDPVDPGRHEDTPRRSSSPVTSPATSPTATAGDRGRPPGRQPHRHPPRPHDAVVDGRRRPGPHGRRGDPRPAPAGHRARGSASPSAPATPAPSAWSTTSATSRCAGPSTASAGRAPAAG